MSGAINKNKEKARQELMRKIRRIDNMMMSTNGSLKDVKEKPKTSGGKPTPKIAFLHRVRKSNIDRTVKLERTGSILH